MSGTGETCHSAKMNVRCAPEAVIGLESVLVTGLARGRCSIRDKGIDGTCLT